MVISVGTNQPGPKKRDSMSEAKHGEWLVDSESGTRLREATAQEIGAFSVQYAIYALSGADDLTVRRMCARAYVFGSPVCYIEGKKTVPSRQSR